MVASVIYVAIILLLIIWLLASSIFVVQQQTVDIIERFGKFHRIVGAGIHARIPLIDRIVKHVELRTMQDKFDLSAKTKDNVTITMTVAVQYRVSQQPGRHIMDSGIYRSYYALADPEDQMKSYIVDALRSTVPQFNLDSVFDEKDAIAESVRRQVANHMIQYGYEVVGTLIQSIGLPADVENAMNSINAAEREKIATQSRAEAEKIRVVTEATARADAMKEAGRGIAEQRKAIAQGIKDSLSTIQEAGVTSQEANELFAFTQWTDMMGEFAHNGRASTVVLPSDFQQTSSMFDQMLAAGKAVK
ncbi:SPFH domain-containing protein [Bifidobacterium gallicum]|uniref:SPFH domain/band 7 family protein n=1 Tax=Bifidobacterium gallicum DSM 20093 = LMG 11596 TaxID=561180 RepID=D1NUP7_9BIFI|nr:SPFH domain-containing protein [Bifidobacterium gallicum]EFA22548.1 SPFH/Band 7/PHB domain protein [Bifidobacterium gallicum DSM 20093 = LMG 11596]KFI59538.1 SPFH domain/band 7 family protein [Bifidobacterium gallicum DSM 20093 = LMG 11596]